MGQIQLSNCIFCTYHVDGDVRPESDVDGCVELGEDVEDLGEAGDVGHEVAGAGEVREVARGAGQRGQQQCPEEKDLHLWQLSLKHTYQLLGPKLLLPISCVKLGEKKIAFTCLLWGKKAN